MVTTKRIEIFIRESDKNIKKEYQKKLSNSIGVAVKAANMCASHLFALDNTMPYLSEEDKETITFLGVKGNEATRANAPYVAASEAFKGKTDMKMLSNVIQNVRKMYESDKKDGGFFKKSLRSYKSNIPVPFDKRRFKDMRFEKYVDKNGNEKEACLFTIMGIPFQMKFGVDRSNNRGVVKRVISEEYKMSTSSIQVKEDKIYLLLCVEEPKAEYKLVNGKKMFAFLGVMNPITCFVSTKDDNDLSLMNLYHIGTKEEFNYRRRQIQEAVRRCQKYNKYTKGGKGRKRKTQAIERFHDKEKNYVETKLHTYSKILVEYAKRNKCSEIVLIDQKSREEKAKEDNKKGDPFVLRNWSYYGLKNKIKYKAEKYGIKLSEKNDTRFS